MTFDDSLDDLLAAARAPQPLLRWLIVTVPKDGERRFQFSDDWNQAHAVAREALASGARVELYRRRKVAAA